jgi:RHH-type proline utilization regulon transcriptional repressor/proline dehydrogenase/delta 1-pyrroline-5-carboxylate dehydrogenase
MIFASPPELDAKRLAINALYRADEADVVRKLLRKAEVSAGLRNKIARRARNLVKAVRAARLKRGGIDAFLQEYELSSEEGVVLMCLAEALLRIPDAETADRLIRDKIGGANWQRHVGASESLFVNASTWALMLTGRLLGPQPLAKGDLGAAFKRLVTRSGEPIIRNAMTQAMRILGRQFVMGRTIDEALERAREDAAEGYRHSFDMLGEAARTAVDATRYFDAYAAAIARIGEVGTGEGPIDRPGISVKLSALHPRYEYAQRERALAELTPRLIALSAIAKQVNIGLTVDAEEADRLDLSLDVFERVSAAPELAGWDGLGLAVQAYQKRTLALIDWLATIAQRDGRRLMVRLVKGAYWDSEIKRGQERGLEGYPVFTRKASTDVSYIACAHRLLEDRSSFYPQFATHNAHTLATVEALAGATGAFEYQRLHGMGEALYDEIVGPEPDAPKCRIYAPVGSHEDLLPYLVRRLLENGANTSFVNRIVDEDLPIARIIADPVEAMAETKPIPHPRIPLPSDMFGEERRNSAGIDLSDPVALQALAEDMEAATEHDWVAAPGAPAGGANGDARPLSDPSDRRRVVGGVHDATSEQVGRAVGAAEAAFEDWTRRPAAERAACLERAADLFDEHRALLMAIAVREAGKTLPDALGEVREAIDFLRYYAARARSDFGNPLAMPGPTGERNELALHGRGVFACISPWNFPLAIFTGQVSAALAAGNTVLAKPAEQTPLMAAQAVRLMHQAGIPEDVLILLPGDGPSVGAPLVADPRIAGVAFTGSTEVAWAINRTLAARDGPIAPLIAETGGQNALIVDSSALAEQVVEDTLESAFNSAGQRCSALRVLFLQSDIADRTIEMLAGAMAELRMGDPAFLSTDIGPVIDEDARSMLAEHAERMDREARLIHQVALSDGLEHGTFFAPRAYEIDGLARLQREVFGPILHIIRYEADKIDAVVDAVNATGYGLTLGIHSRIDATVRAVHARIRAGNAYVNRNMIGAIVGSQPFGGEGLSGTGPKAGGPHYLHRFAVERALSVDTTAAGGNAALMTLEDD